jgi:hypothetical protein
MNSFLRQMESKFIEFESTEDVVPEEEIDEQNVSGAIAGYNTPNAFAKPDNWKNKKVGYASGVDESINMPPQYSLKDGTYQHPESEEEEYNSKFPFSNDQSDWQHASYEYPSKNLVGTPGTITKKHKTLRVEDVLDRKYEKLIEGYRDFVTGDKNLSPERKVKSTIQEIAKKLQEIETLVNYNSKLKTESGVTSAAYGSSTNKALQKISERLIKISERVRSLGE